MPTPHELCANLFSMCMLMSDNKLFLFPKNGLSLFKEIVLPSFKIARNRVFLIVAYPSSLI